MGRFDTIPDTQHKNTAHAIMTVHACAEVEYVAQLVVLFDVFIAPLLASFKAKPTLTHTLSLSLSVSLCLSLSLSVSLCLSLSLCLSRSLSLS